MQKWAKADEAKTGGRLCLLGTPPWPGWLFMSSGLSDSSVTRDPLQLRHPVTLVLGPAMSSSG